MKVGIVMDPIQTIHPGHDSTLALLLEASRRGATLFYFEAKNIYLKNGVTYGEAKILNVFSNTECWFAFENHVQMELSELDILFIRNDPPFDQEYLYLTQLLEVAEKAGVLVVNKPQALRDINEKLAITLFPACCVPTVVSSDMALLKAFLQEEKDIVCKPLHVMGGQSIFRIKSGDLNANVIFEMLTENETRKVMVQRFIPEIEYGDKRIILIDGEPIPFALARIPKAGDWRGNMAVGAKPVAQSLTARDRWICEQLNVFLREKGLYFVGIDVIGDYLTEINVTSPTGIRELDEQVQLNISGQLFNRLESFLV